MRPGAVLSCLSARDLTTHPPLQEIFRLNATTLLRIRVSFTPVTRPFASACRHRGLDFLPYCSLAAGLHLGRPASEVALICHETWGGVCERHPKLRIGVLESGGGWIAPWLDRMDRHFDDQGFNDSGLKTRPGELFQRNCWISFEPVEGSLNVLADYIGPNKILWATDYPHPDGFFPAAPQMMLDRLEGTSAATKHGVMAGGAMRFYGL